MATIPQPLQDPSPSPEAILAGNNARLLQTVQQFGPAQAADRQYQFDREQALQAQRIQGEKEIAQWHERAAQIRADAQDRIWDKRIEAQAKTAAATEKTRLEAIDERELTKEAARYRSGIQDPKTGQYVPGIDQHNNESLRDYVIRAGSERAKYEAERDGTIQKNTQMLQGKMDGVMGDWEKSNQEAAHSAGAAAVNQNFAALLPTGHLGFGNVRQRFLDTLQKNQEAGMTYEQALAKTQASDPKAFAGAMDAYNDASSNRLMQLRAAKSPMLENQIGYYKDLLKNPAALAHSDFKIPDLPASATATIPATLGGVDLNLIRRGGGGAPGAPQTNQFLPDGLQSPDALSLAAKYHPMGANLTQDTGDILGNAVAGAKQKITQGQAALRELGVAVGPDGKLSVPPTKQTIVGAGFDGRVATMPTPMSPAERQQRYSKAQSILQNMQQAQTDIGRLSSLGSARSNNVDPYGQEPGGDQQPAPSSFNPYGQEPTPNDVLSGR